MPRTHTATRNKRRHGRHLVRKAPCGLIAAARYGFAERRDKSGRQRPFGEQITQQIGNAKCDCERIQRAAAAEQSCKDQLSRQPKNAAAHHRQSDDAGRLGIQAVAALIGWCHGSRSG